MRKNGAFFIAALWINLNNISMEIMKENAIKMSFAKYLPLYIHLKVIKFQKLCNVKKLTT